MAGCEFLFADSDNYAMICCGRVATLWFGALFVFLIVSTDLLVRGLDHNYNYILCILLQACFLIKFKL